MVTKQNQITHLYVRDSLSLVSSLFSTCRKDLAAFDKNQLSLQ